jgi:UDP-N-acetylmuramoylalanine--D-glutamate ligase
VSGPLWLILGGKDKGSDYHPLIPVLRDRLREALLIGTAAEKIASHLDGALPARTLETLDAAVDYASRQAQSGDCVLLAPACASFDQFRSFEHRGETFKELVRQLPEKG